MIPDDSSSMATTVMGVTPSAHVSAQHHVCELYQLTGVVTAGQCRLKGVP